MEVYGKVREEVGEEFPVLVKLTGGDNLAGGLENDEAVYIAKKLSEAGIDAIEVSGGTTASEDLNPARQMILTPDLEAYNMELARPIREAVKCPVMVVGGFRSYDVVEKALQDDHIDYVSFARPLIREPGLANRWARGERSPATCISCNGCFLPGLKEGGIYCVVDRKAGGGAKKA
jgi:2,4-dienoyl-CoA reductase-like NADH-dependent reductase (Old Yellow Enzyme family)